MFFRKLYLTFLFNSVFVFLNAQSSGGITTGSAMYCDSVNSGFISLNAFNGQVLHWESSTDKGQTWINLPNTTSTQSYNKLMRTTSYRAIVKDGSFLQDTSSVSTITVYVPGNAGKLNGGGSFCSDAGNGSLTLSSPSGNVLYWQLSIANSPAWKTINNTSTTLSYSSLTENTHYRVVVATVPGCPDDTTNTITFNIQPRTIAGTILKGDSLCYGSPGDTLRLTEYAGEILGWFSSKDNGINWLALPDTTAFITYSSVTQNSLYKATVKNGICNTETTTPVVLALYNTNPANAGEDITITRNDKINLQGNGNGSPQWSDPEYLTDAFSFNPVANPMNTTLYILTLKDTHGCITKDSVTVNVIVPVPTAITPNGDGVNDYFEIDKISQYEQNSLLIFNRWGMQVYKSEPYKNEWNGKSQNGHDLPDELYYYIFNPGNGEKVITNYILIKR